MCLVPCTRIPLTVFCPLSVPVAVDAEHVSCTHFLHLEDMPNIPGDGEHVSCSHFRYLEDILTVSMTRAATPLSKPGWPGTLTECAE